MAVSKVFFGYSPWGGCKSCVRFVCLGWKLKLSLMNKLNQFGNGTGKGGRAAPSMFFLRSNFTTRKNKNGKGKVKF